MEYSYRSLPRFFLHETVDIFLNDLPLSLNKDKTLPDNLSKNFYRELLTRNFSESFILCDKWVYKQHDGAVTGSPTGPTFSLLP